MEKLAEMAQFGEIENVISTTIDFGSDLLEYQ